jgi:hypothetical protein
MRRLDPFLLAHLFVLSGLAIVVGLLDDALLFKSDAVSLALFLLHAALLLLVPLALGIGAAMLAGASPERVTAVLGVLCVANVLFGFAVYGFDTFIYRIPSPAAFALFAVALYAATLALAVRTGLEAGRRATVRALARTVAALTVVLVLALDGYRLAGYHLPGRGAAHADTGPRNAVLVVLDGLSTRYLSPYADDADTPGFEEVAADSVRFTRAHTDYAYTAGYFGTLYSGRKTRMPGPRNLFSLLQGAGVNVRWTSFHNAGVPDAITLPYRGLRSAFLTQHYTWVPRLLGLDYGVFRYSTGGKRGKGMGAREQAVFHVLNRGFSDGNLLETDLLDQLDELHRDGRPFLLVYHPTHNGQVRLAPGQMKEALGAWVDDDPGSTRAAVRARIRARDYRYLPEEADFVARLGAEYAFRVRAGAASLARFLAAFKARGWERDTLLIVTADHGQMFERGRVWYSHHIDEEVARVPLLIHYNGRKGTDDRLVETIDITQTLLEYFGVQERISPFARSLLAPPAKDMTTTLAHESPAQHEWLAAVYLGDRKYVVDLAKGARPVPEASGVVRGLAVTPEPGGGLEPEAVRRMDEALRAYFGKG